MDSVIDMEGARRLVADAVLWPLVRDFLWDFAPQIHPSRLPDGFSEMAGQPPRIRRYVMGVLGVAPVFHDFPASDNSRLILLPGGSLESLARWLGALACAQSLRRITDGARVRALKASLPDVYPAVFSYTAYFKGFGGEASGVFDGLDGEGTVSKVVETGYGLLFSLVSALPEGLLRRLELKLPQTAAPAGAQTVAQPILHKILRLKFPEAYTLCCS